MRVVQVVVAEGVGGLDLDWRPGPNSFHPNREKKLESPLDVRTAPSEVAYKEHNRGSEGPAEYAESGLW